MSRSSDGACVLFESGQLEMEHVPQQHLVTKKYRGRGARVSTAAQTGAPCTHTHTHTHTRVFKHYPTAPNPRGIAREAPVQTVPVVVAQVTVTAPSGRTLRRRWESSPLDARDWTWRQGTSARRDAPPLSRHQGTASPLCSSGRSMPCRSAPCTDRRRRARATAMATTAQSSLKPGPGCGETRLLGRPD